MKRLSKKNFINHIDGQLLDKFKIITTQEAADLLNVSRPYLISLLKEGKIPFCKVKAKYRILAKDVIHYKTSIDKKRFRILKVLSKQAQELDMGY